MAQTQVDQMQLEMADMPVRLFSCTPSRLTTWIDCPRRYRLTYVDRPAPPKGPPWAHNSVGAAVHVALKDWYDLPVERRTAANAGHLVRERWQPLGFRDDAQAIAWREHAAGMVERYADTVDPLDEPVGVERTVALKTPTLALSGRIDRLDRRDGELVVVDYKTGRHLLTTDDARGSLALAVYAMAAARTMRTTCTRVELHHLPTGEIITWEHSQASLERHLARASDIASQIVAAKENPDLDAAYPTMPGRQCSWCDVAAHCPIGQQQPRTAPWAGLADDVAPQLGPDSQLQV